MEEDYEYDDVMSTDAYCNFTCPKCGGDIEVENSLDELCQEPFNGAGVECQNENCKQEYQLSMYVGIMSC